jgi:DNA primase
VSRSFSRGKPLYNLPQLLARPADPVWFVEGELCADHLTKLGVLSTTSGGSTSAKHADFAPLAKRRVIIWPDNDEPGLRHAHEIAEGLSAVSASVRLVDIVKLNLPLKGDAVDWLKAHPDASSHDLNTLPMVPYTKVKSATVEAEIWPEQLSDDV